MTGRVFLPQSQTSLISQRGVTMAEFYRWFQYIDRAISTNGSNGQNYADQIKAIALALGSPDGTVANIPPQGNQAIINGTGSIEVSGTLESGVVNLSLFGDASYPANTSYYGTNTSGKRGFYALSSGFLGTAGQIVDTVDPVTGVSTFSLPDVGNTGTGSIRGFDLDTKGRVTGYRTVTTNDLTEGATNLYFTTARAKDAVGASLVDSSTIDFTYDSTAKTITAVLQPVTNAGGGVLRVITVDGFGRVSGSTARTITGGSSYVSVTNGTGAAGDPTIDLSATSKTSLGKADTAVQSVVAGTGVSVNNADPRNPVVSATGAGSGTVTSVGLSAPSIFTVSGSPVTASGTLALALATEPAATVLAGPVSGSAAIPAFRSLYDSDISVSFLEDQTGVTLTDQLNVPLQANSYTFSVQWANVTGRPTTLAGYGITDAIVKMGDLPFHPPYLTTTVPLASSNQYRTVTITNLAEGARICWSDGVNWRRLSDNSIAV